jgi:hypothetical protein
MEEYSMYKTRVNHLADVIEKEANPTNFTMVTWGNLERMQPESMPYQVECGTPGCIGAWVASLWGKVDDNEREPKDFSDLVALKLDIPYHEAYKLCIKFPHAATAQRAVATLRNLSNTGKVVWQ